MYDMYNIHDMICICVHMWWDNTNFLITVKPRWFFYPEDIVKSRQMSFF